MCPYVLIYASIYLLPIYLCIDLSRGRMDRADQHRLSVFSAEYLEVKLHLVFNVDGARRAGSSCKAMIHIYKHVAEPDVS